MSQTTSITVESSKGTQTVVTRAHAHTRLTEVLRHADLPLNTRCGEHGLCDGCIVELVRGSLYNKALARNVTADGQAIAVRACEHHVPVEGGELTIRIPPRSLLAHQPQVVSEFRINVPWSHDPIVPGPFSDNGGPRTYGAAIDIGTTTVAVLLVDLATGEMVSRAVNFNRQMSLGDDVLTRINLCCTDKAMVGQLHEAIIEQTIQPLIAEAVRHAGKDHAGRIACITLAGNTTMLHLAAGVDPSPMGMAPFPAVFLEQRDLSCSQIGLALPAAEPTPALQREGSEGSAEAASGAEAGTAYPNSQVTNKLPDPPVYLLPGAAAYIGADLVAGILASGLAYEEGPSLLVDVGTNGEIILKHGERLLGCATAAGPAFEGSRLTSGIRAGHGAICDIHIRAKPFGFETKVIGGEATERRSDGATKGASSPDSHLPSPVSDSSASTSAIGLCGSAYIDFLSEARRTGLIGPSGRFDEEFLAAHVPAELLSSGEPAEGRKLRIAQGRGRRDLVISEGDIAMLLQAKAAIAAGILTLLHQAGLAPEQIKTLHLAGGFGTHMNRAHAIGCGLLPGFATRQVEVVGNSSLAGAYLALLDSSVLPELERIARRLTVVELNLDPTFEDRYIDQLSLP